MYKRQELDQELEEEGLARELIHFIQGERKAAGFEIADRITIEIAPNALAERVLARFGDEIASETLCTTLTSLAHVDGNAFESDGCSVVVRVALAT